VGYSLDRAAETEAPSAAHFEAASGVRNVAVGVDFQITGAPRNVPLAHPLLFPLGFLGPLVAAPTGTNHRVCTYSVPKHQRLRYSCLFLLSQMGRPSMTDYRSIIAWAVSHLPSTADEARQTIYEQARTALHKRLVMTRKYQMPSW